MHGVPTDFGAGENKKKKKKELEAIPFSEKKKKYSFPGQLNNIFFFYY